MTVPVTDAASLCRAWADDLAAWQLPESVTAQVEESPWVLPTEVFARRADHLLANPGGPSYKRALEALEGGGSVLDVGAGGGAASLPLTCRTTQLTTLDSHQPMLDDLVRRAAPLDVAVLTLCGRWPDVAPQAPTADVVVCHHVLYNVADIAPFVAALTTHARRRVIVELTVRHPLTALNPYWQEFHGLKRPDGPTADQVVDVLRALGLPVKLEQWTRPATAEYAAFDTLVDITRRRLCLPPQRTADVAAALRRRGVSAHQPPDIGSSGNDLVTLWWPGTAPSHSDHGADRTHRSHGPAGGPNPWS
jgi:SAM-dependent methyltransferase